MWSEGDFGERWQDIGKDGCHDEYEDGMGGCTTIDLSPYNAESNIDPNGDNYNIDPNGDDYPNGLEGNNILDEGELWLDYGLDGIPETHDEYEGDGKFQEDFEYFFDYGLDNISSPNEFGFCGIENVCTENNNKYDFGELKNEDDNGEDGCSDEYEDGSGGCTTVALSLFDSELNVDPNGDNYNIDPNKDNYNVDADSGTEGNLDLNWTDGNNNQIWDENEGEEWFDYGLDKTQDIYEQYLPENQIIVSSGINSYEIDVKNFKEYVNNEIPEFGEENQVALWISSIVYNSADSTYDLTISIYSERKLNGIKFNLENPEVGSNLKVSWLEDYERHYVQNVSWHDYENSDGEIIYEKMFEDISLYPLRSKLLYSELLSENLGLTNYANDIYCQLESEEFKNFVNNYSSGVISRLHSKIIIPADTLLTNFYDNEFKVDLGLSGDSFDENEYMSSSLYGSNLDLSSGYALIDYNNPKLEILIGDLIQYHISKDIPFRGFTLKNNSQSNIFNSLYLNYEDAYIYMVFQK